MARKVLRLTVDNFIATPSPCRACLFWEFDPVRRSRVDRDDVESEKQAWISEVLRDWGSCGRVAMLDEQPVGFIMYAPAAYVPGAMNFPTAPVSADAVLVTTAYLAPEYRGVGLGRMLVQGVARDLIERGGWKAMECFATVRGTRSGLIPQAFLESVGFKTQRPHPTTPRMRMELTSTVRWRDEVETALERMFGAVRPAPEATRQNG